MAVTERATELKMVLSDLDDLKFINTKLADMYADANTPVFKQCENFIRHKVNEYPLSFSSNIFSTLAFPYPYPLPFPLVFLLFFCDR